MFYDIIPHQTMSELCIFIDLTYHTLLGCSSPQEPDWNTQRPFLAWTSPSSIKDTFNLAWGKQEPLIHSYMFWYTTKGEKVATTSFYNRKISMIFPLVSCFSCVNNPSSS